MGDGDGGHGVQGTLGVGRGIPDGHGDNELHSVSLEFHLERDGKEIESSLPMVHFPPVGDGGTQEEFLFSTCGPGGICVAAPSLMMIKVRNEPIFKPEYANRNVIRLFNSSIGINYIIGNVNEVNANRKSVK